MSPGSPLTPEPDSDLADLSDLIDLVVRYQDHRLSDDERARLEDRLLREEPARQLFRDVCMQAMTVSELERGAATVSPDAGGWRRARWIWAPLAAIAAAILVWALVLTGRAGPIGRLEDVSGDVRVDQVTVAARVGPGPEARSGVSLRTRGIESSTAFRFADGTRLVIAGETVVTIRDDGRKRVILDRGNLAASVVPQPAGRPLVVVTPHSEIEVRGTQLALNAHGNATVMGVLEGRVAMRRRSDGKSVVVNAREYAVTAAGTDLEARSLPMPPDRLFWDFDRGLPDGWRSGRFRDGTVVAAAAVRRVESIRIHHHICSPAAWTRGLFLVHADSHLSFRYRFKRPGRFYLMVGMRREDPQQPAAGNFEIYDDPVASGLAPNTWRIATIPLRDLVRTTSPRTGPEPGNVAYFVLFSTLDVDRGLEVDWVRVSRTDGNR